MTVRPPIVAQICFIADPFDPPGHGRFGGGHLFLFDLGRQLVRLGYHTVWITRRNDDRKPEREELGSRASIIRLPVGPATELAPDAVAEYLDALTPALGSALEELPVLPSALHSHYWIAGECTRRLRSQLPVSHIHSVLSLGRVKRERSSVAELRDACECQVLATADCLIVVCPDEQAELRRLYPDIHPKQIAVIPYAVDESSFYPRPSGIADSVRRATDRFKKGLGDPA